VSEAWIFVLTQDTDKPIFGGTCIDLEPRDYGYRSVNHHTWSVWTIRRKNNVEITQEECDKKGAAILHGCYSGMLNILNFNRVHTTPGNPGKP